MPRDESPRTSGHDEALSDGARGMVATVVAEKRGRRERAPINQATVKISVARLKKALDDKDRRAVVTAVLKWVVMVTTALVNVATVTELVG
ncbi:hypothetical protein [Haloarcula laminariae]|uniref:hypothetical protein n=1 Tax=Haloarcula laminariae TaxID=2961577 RepID=UPI0021CA7FA7|nr:hypothetical protein [Halomicroarcula laminariae]